MQFSNVLIFDVTYRRKNLRMPFALFIGVNHRLTLVYLEVPY